MVHSTYKAVIFDYGGVLMSYSSEVPEWTKIEMEYELQRGSIQKTLFSIFKDIPGIDKLLFEGHVSAADLEKEILPNYLSTKMGVKLPCPLDVLNLWMGPGRKIPYNENMISVVRSLRSMGIHTSILTNNYKFDKEGLFDRTPIDKSLFDVIVESTLEGCMKPDMEIYEITQSRLPSDILPSQCIFLDDNMDNIEAGNKFGWKSILVKPADVSIAIKELEVLLGVSLL